MRALDGFVDSDVSLLVRQDLFCICAELSQLVPYCV